MEKEKCGKTIKTIDKPMPCLCDKGHAGGCNPFSPNPYMVPVNVPKK